MKPKHGTEPEHDTTPEHDAQPEHGTTPAYDTTPEHDAQPEHGTTPAYDTTPELSPEESVRPRAALTVSARKDVAKQLKTARLDAKVTQETLAARIGTKKSNISRFESGTYNPSLDFLVKLADGLGRQIQIHIK